MGVQKSAEAVVVAVNHAIKGRTGHAASRRQRLVDNRNAEISPRRLSPESRPEAEDDA